MIDMAYDFTGVKAIVIPEGNVKKITDSAGNAIWRALTVIANVPSQKGTLTYTGSELSPSWYNFDSNQLTIGGNKRTNAGSYFAVFTPKDGYCWSDGSTDAKTVVWKINKAAGSLSISPTSITLDSSTTNKTIAVTRAGDGTVSAVSSNTSVATVSVSGTTVTVTKVGVGEATITVSVAAGTNHNAPSSNTCAVTVKVKYKMVRTSFLNIPYYIYDTVTVYQDISFDENTGTITGKNQVFNGPLAPYVTQYSYNYIKGNWIYVTYVASSSDQNYMLLSGDSITVEQE